MHEVSIAESLVGVVLANRPAGMKVREVHVEAGAMVAVDKGAMEMAWEVVTMETELAGSRIVLKVLPWTLTCRTCGQVWEATDPFEICVCGSDQVTPKGTGELRVVSLEVEGDTQVAGSK